MLHRYIDPSHAPEALRDLDWIEDVSFDRLLEKLLNALMIDKEDWNHAGRWLRLGNEWEKDHKQNSGLLLHGKELRKAEDWLKRAECWRLEGSNKGPQPQPSHIKFVRESRRAANHFFLASVIAIFLLIGFTGGGAFLLLRPPDPTLVTTLNDSGQGSLRWCIVNAPSGKTITFAKGLNGTIKLKGDLTFQGGKQLTIAGPGANQLTISATNASIDVPTSATVTLTGLSFKNSSETVGGGAFLYNQGTLTVKQSIISGNKTTSTDQATGAAIENTSTGNLTVMDTSILNNSVNGQQWGQGAGIDNGGKLTVNNSIFANNTAISGNNIAVGGGIATSQTGIVMVTSSSFLHNSASGKQYGDGGGIHTSGKLTVVNSTYSSNTASSSDGSGAGGGIYNYYTGTVMVTNSTFSHNLASGKQYGYGGGIGFTGRQGSSTLIRFSTLYANTSDTDGGGIWIDPTGRNLLMISDSIIAANSAPSGPDISGAVISGGYNLIENTAGATGLYASGDRQVTVADLKIDTSLGNNEGPTQTLALLPGSVAIDAVPLQACSITITDPWGHNVTITTDQRGHPRADGSENACDVGAYESS